MKALKDAVFFYRNRCQLYATPENREQVTLTDRFFSLLEKGEATLFREHADPGHFTASLLVTTPRLDQVLLHLHSKLGLWLQLGGHADGEADLAAVARRECEEESGLGNTSFFPLKKYFPEDRSESLFLISIFTGYPSEKLNLAIGITMSVFWE
jgi:8-oxo-dGTP pyrophosphatase MutT (NUDIX family)